MTSHEFLREKFPDTLQEGYAVVMVMVKVTDGRDRGIIWRDGDGESGNFRQTTVFKRAVKCRALVKFMLLWNQFNLEVVEYCQLSQQTGRDGWTL